MEVQAQEVAILQLLERRQAPAAQPDHAVMLSNAVLHLWAEQVLLALALAAASPDDTCSLCRTSVSGPCQQPMALAMSSDSKSRHRLSET